MQSSNPPQGQGHRRRDAAPCWRMRPRADLTSDPPTWRKVWIWSSSWMARFRSSRFSASNRSSTLDRTLITSLTSGIRVANISMLLLTLCYSCNMRQAGIGHCPETSDGKEGKALESGNHR